MASDAVNRNINNNNTNNNLVIRPQVFYPSADANAHRMLSSSSAQASLIHEFWDKPGSSSTPSSSSSSSFFQPTLVASQAHPSLHSPSKSSDLSTDPPPTFSEQEDEILRELVKRHGTKKWHIISAKMRKKTPRECRKRCLLQGHNAYGNRWTEIAKMVPGRTDNAVKNRYNALCTKQSHRIVRPSHTNAKRQMGSWANGQQPWVKVRFRVPNMAFELSIGIPEDLGINRLGTGMKHTADNYTTDQNTSSENHLMIEDATSPKGGQVDMEEVMSWLLTQTPTPTFDCGGNSNSTVTSCTESP